MSKVTGKQPMLKLALKGTTIGKILRGKFSTICFKYQHDFVDI
ncbi:MAG: hypothetical protein U5L45_09775 [Saprospiraceae bacterium]|nr:hypothetical protein [Saprospiraceae bacterium]